MTESVKRVVIVGRDAAAWLSALALRRAFGGTGVRVEVVELPSLLREVDAYAAVPSLGGLHRLLGLRQTDVLRACSGVPSLGQRFANWSGSKPAFIHAYDAQRPAIKDVDFLQFWVKARSEGLRVEFEDFSAVAVSAKQGRMPPQQGDRDSIAAASPGYHLHAPAYVRFIREHALRSGVERRQGQLASVERKGDRIAAVTLDDGQRIEGDLFIDASGTESALIGELPGAEMDYWDEWLGCDRILAASAPALKPVPAYAQISAFRSGWIGLHPLQDRTAVVAAYNSRELSDREMLDNAGILTGMALHGDAVATPFRTGARPRPWIGNCVALGEGAASLEPLDAVQLHLIHLGLSHLISFFPVDAAEMPEAGAYNAAFMSHVRNVRDFQIAHYKLNQRYDEPFWDRAREADGPESLDAKIRLFKSRGRIALYDDESFQEQNWTSIFIGHGLMPGSYDPLVDLVPPEDQMQKFQRLLHLIAGEVQAMPTMDTYLEQLVRRSPSVGAS